MLHASVIFENGREDGPRGLRDKSIVIVMDGRQKTSAMHMMHASNRALAQLWLGLNDEMSCRYLGLFAIR